ncbi:MAG: PEP-CTERM sorting domain-containing protein, partial [Verrucomicrobiota bacterium]
TPHFISAKNLAIISMGYINGKVALASGVNEMVNTLFFGTQSQISGTWGATGSGALNINDTYFSGLGMLTVAVPEPATWLLLAATGTFFMVMRRRRE